MGKSCAAILEPAYFPLFFKVAEETYVLKVDFTRLSETANPANQIFNGTRKDDPADDNPANPLSQRDANGDTYGTPRNTLYLVESPADSLYHVTLEVNDQPTSARGKLMHAVYGGGAKLPTGEGFFPPSGPANITFNHPLTSAAEVTDFEIKAGYDLNGSNTLDADEILSPLKVKNVDVVIGPPIVRGGSDVRYALARLAVDVEIGANPNSHAGPLLQIFRDGTILGLPPDKRPTPNVTGISCFSGAYSEWLTHNCGAPFSSSGSAQIPNYTWDRFTSFAELVGHSHQITAAGESLYTASVEPDVVAYFATKAVGEIATFPLTGGFYSVPHVSLSPGWPFTTVAFDEPWIPYALDDVQGAIGRGRLISHEAQYTVEKKSLLGIGYLDVTEVRYVGVVEDLYDWNYESTLIAGQPAIVQIGHGNGSYGASRDVGKIYRDRIEFNVVISDPF